jgi:hypothetical protein
MAEKQGGAEEDGQRSRPLHGTWSEGGRGRGSEESQRLQSSGDECRLDVRLQCGQGTTEVS